MLHRNYEKHIKEVNSRNKKLGRISESEFGILEENFTTLNKSRDKVINSSIIKEKERNLEINRNNNFLYKKLVSIQNRDNV